MKASPALGQREEEFIHRFIDVLQKAGARVQLNASTKPTADPPDIQRGGFELAH